MKFMSFDLIQQTLRTIIYVLSQMIKETTNVKRFRYCDVNTMKIDMNKIVMRYAEDFLNKKS